MPEYHVGCGIAGIYAGTLNEKGDRWLNKSDVTEEAVWSVVQHLYDQIPKENNGIAYVYTFRKGDKIRVSIERVKEVW